MECRRQGGLFPRRRSNGVPSTGWFVSASQEQWSAVDRVVCFRVAGAMECRRQGDLFSASQEQWSVVGRVVCFQRRRSNGVPSTGWYVFGVTGAMECRRQGGMFSASQDGLVTQLAAARIPTDGSSEPARAAGCVGCGGGGRGRAGAHCRVQRPVWGDPSGSDQTQTALLAKWWP